MMDLQRVNAYMSKVEESEKKVLPHEGKRLKTGLDLGTAYIVLVVLDENDQPVACEKQAASVLRDGVVVDYSGACRIVRELKEKLEERLGEELIDCAIAMPAGTHLSLVLAGNYHVSFAEAEAIKQDYARHKEILPVVRPVIEKMATIVRKYVDPSKIDTIYLCGGTTCLTGIEGIFEKVTGIHTVKPANPFLVTPAGIARNCILSEG